MKSLYISVFMLTAFFSSAQQNYKQKTFLMGCNFEITVVAQNQHEADGYVQSAVDEIRRIEKLISSWDTNSQTYEINQNAGIRPIKADDELISLIERAKGISKMTDGAFDISYASMDKVWHFDGSMKTMPSEEEIQASVARVGYNKICIDRKAGTVYLAEQGMKIGFGAIGKGYAADRARDLLESKGVAGGIINASGDLNAWGKQANSEAWKIGITNPKAKESVFALMPLQNEAVVTSGNYEKFVEFNGIRYSHIIDPRTGYPSTGIISATVFAPKAELADALATSVFVMGIEAGLDRINQLPGVECILIDEQGKIFKSDNIKIEKL